MHPVLANPSAQGVFIGARRRSSNNGCCSSSSSSFSSSFSFQQSRSVSFSPREKKKRNVTQNATAGNEESALALRRIDEEGEEGEEELWFAVSRDLVPDAAAGVSLFAQN